MATLKYADILPFILPDVTGCSEPLAEQAISETVMDFCARTSLWRAFLDPITVAPGRYEYDLDVPIGATLINIRTAVLNGKAIMPQHDDFVAENYPMWQTETGTPKFFFQSASETFNLVPCPNVSAANGLIIQVALKPSLSSRTFPEWIYAKYMTGLNAGIKARLMMKPGHPFTSPRIAQILQAEFLSCIASAMNTSQQSLVRSALRTTSQH